MDNLQEVKVFIETEIEVFTSIKFLIEKLIDLNIVVDPMITSDYSNIFLDVLDYPNFAALVSLLKSIGYETCGSEFTHQYVEVHFENEDSPLTNINVKVLGF